MHLLKAARMIYLRSIMAGIVAVVVCTILAAGVALLIVTRMGGYWGWDFWPVGGVSVLLTFAAASTGSSEGCQSGGVRLQAKRGLGDFQVAAKRLDGLS